MKHSEFTFLTTTSKKAHTPTITVRRGGILALNESALDLLGEEVTHVQIGFDEKKNAIGLRPAEEGTAGRYRLRKQAKSKARLVDGKRLFALHGLTFEKAKAFQAIDFGDGIVGLKLNGEPTTENMEPKTRETETEKAKAPSRKQKA